MAGEVCRRGGGRSGQRRRAQNGAAAAAQGKRQAADGAGDFKKSGGILCQGAAVKFAFVRDHQKRWPAATICRVLQVSRSGFYAFCKRKPSARARRQAQLLEKIRIVHQEHREVYGSPRVYRALRIEGQHVSRNTVARLMKSANIRGKSRKRFIPRTTDSRHQKQIADNKLS